MLNFLTNSNRASLSHYWSHKCLHPAAQLDCQKLLTMITQGKIAIKNNVDEDHVIRISPKILHGEQHGDLWLRSHHWGQNIHHYAHVSSWLSLQLSRLIKWPDNLTAGTTLLPCGLGWAPPSALAAQLSSGFPLVTDGGGKTVTKWLRSRQDNDYKREWQKSNGRKKFSARHFWSDCVKYKATTAQYIGEICRCFNA